MASNHRGPAAPIDYPPPVDPLKEFVKRELDAEDERIDVGVAIVGGGTAGLACANRLLQLLADDEALLERLGEVPVAVIEKAKTCGGHSLSGAVMRPGPLQEPDRARQARLAATDDGDADLDPLVLGIGGRADELLSGVHRRRELARSDAHEPFLAFTASVSFGTILLRSPTMPRSENSKIGAFGSLLIATMFSELCIPTLCWIAPEIPAAR